MERIHESNIGKFVARRMSSVRTVLRLLRHEIDVGSTDGRTVTLERGVLDDSMGTLEMFVDDFEQATGKTSGEARRETNGAKPAPARIK